MTEQTPSPVVETSDGVSITSLDELRAYLHSEHGISVDVHDPIMMQFTMNRVFLGDYQTMLDRHNQAITTVIGSAVKGLTEEAIKANLQEQVRLTDRTHQEFERQYQRAKLLSVVNFTVFFLILLIFIYFISR